MEKETTRKSDPFLSGHIFPACHGSDFIHVLHRILTIYPQEYHFVSSHLRCSRELYSLACVRVLLLFYHGHVPRLLCRYDTKTKTLTLNSIVMVLSNVVFNYILIFGKFGFPQLGIAGAAIGSSLAEMVSVIFFIIYTGSGLTAGSMH